MMDGVIVLHLFHAYGCGDDLMKGGVPVEIDYLLMN
mgnify:FL=1